jgi:isocitrate dehydrogenase kinase/phosphatase
MVSNRQQMMSWQIASIILQGFRKHIRGFQSVTTLARQRLATAAAIVSFRTKWQA